MPDLLHSLQGRDLSHLRFVAERWGIELNAPDFHRALQVLTSAMLEDSLVGEIIDSLSIEAKDALYELLQNDGRIPWAAFIRKFGDIRKMGAARKDRERPDRSPATPTEALWYHAFIARAFFEDEEGLNEYAYIPNDLITLLPEIHDPSQDPLGRPASPTERAHIIKATEHILDHAATLLAALRLEILSATDSIESKTLAEEIPGDQAAAIRVLIKDAKLINDNEIPEASQTRKFLEKSRASALCFLIKTWLHSSMFDELRMLPNLRPEGDWVNQPVRTRRVIIDFIFTIPEDAWWNLNSFIDAIKERHPDFQRPAGDYDSYHLVDKETGEFIRGFKNWHRVDGELLRFMVTGPLHWLGLIDLASPGPGLPITAFKISRWGADLLQLKAPPGFPEETERVLVRSDGQIRIPRLAPRVARYQISRFAQWLPQGKHEYRYRLTPSSLNRARNQGLRVNHLITLLARYSEASIPPNISAGLNRWEKQGREAIVEHLTVLSLNSPETLKSLQNSRAGRFILYPISPVKVVLRPGTETKVLEILAEMGFLGEILATDNLDQ